MSGPQSLEGNIERVRKQVLELLGQPSAPRSGVEAARSLVGMIDHTLLKPEATTAGIETLCAEARRWGFATVCVNPVFVSLCASLLQGSPVKVATVVGFPLGANAPEVKAYEALRALDAGAHEIDMVLHIGALKGGEYRGVERDIRGVVDVCRGRGGLVKVILETALLSEEEKIAGCLLSQAAGADFVKTSTGFSSSGATPEDVALMRRVVGPAVGVKAAGGVRSLDDARRMIQAGANRLGTSSGVKIAQELESGGTNSASTLPESGY